MTIKDIILNAMNRSSRVKEISEERRFQRLAEQREKNSNERELERFYEEERQKQIKQRLEQFRKHRSAENWKSNTFQEKYMFKDDKPILKEKNIFKNGFKSNQFGRSVYIR